ncbi:hypothetical protein AVEN_203289-1 [Araneus ventricosus]|uniref:Uncharacterized protein n=1 Tax=Araneus ventricosus TaxID=182803 RepID=A0A4Y2VTU4_ARAVE|nr:hypothetical protein AVEN_203287-1 [Araneus ventricosus]GBO28569.1 hypothetical protein AVEN_203289-1 [Araneus ventricosus]
MLCASNTIPSLTSRPPLPPTFLGHPIILYTLVKLADFFEIPLLRYRDVQKTFSDNWKSRGPLSEFGLIYFRRLKDLVNSSYCWEGMIIAFPDFDRWTLG